MSSHKVSRAQEDIKRELTDIMRSLKDPRISGMLSIVKLELSNDMSHCLVYVSSLEGIEKTKESVKGLNSAGGFIRREINLRLDIRRSPDFKFVADDSIEVSANILKVLHDIQSEDEKREEAHRVKPLEEE